MLKNYINKYRVMNERHKVVEFNGQVSQYCFAHCVAMANQHNLYHAPSHYLNGWHEAVGALSYSDNWADEILSYMINSDDGHRSVILNCSEIAYAHYISNNCVYVCIRGC
jgi:hypothetical protein